MTFKNKIFLRADGYAQIGTGHVMRCLALGQGIQDRGWEVVFVTYCESDGLRARLGKEGFRLHVLKEPGSLDECLNVCEKENPDWVVLDGYHFETKYQKAVKEAGHRLLYIDDYAHLDHYYADIILNQNYGSEKFRYNAERHTRVLAGTRYALLRQEFLEYAKFRREIPDMARKVLITMGGADPENHTRRVVKAVSLIDVPLGVKVVIGVGNPHYESVAQQIARGRHNTEIIEAVEEMAPMMAWADAAISAGGSTIWELAFMGLPSLLCIVAANQENAVNALAHDGVFQSLGWIKDRSIEEIAEAMTHLLKPRSVRADMCAKERVAVDGKGITRVCDTMEKGIFRSGDVSDSLRRDIDSGAVSFVNFVNFSEEEEELVLAWRNSDEIRSHMFNDQIILREEHWRFIEKLKHDGNNFYWMVREATGPLGVVSAQRIDHDAKSCFLGIYAIKKGGGATIVKHFLNFWFSVMKMETVRCEVLADNSRARQFFRRNGFVERGGARFVEKNGSRRKVITFAIGAAEYCAPREDDAA